MISEARFSAPPVLEMRGIRKTFPGVVALDGVDFDVRSGEVHVLVGENGAGKSTLMKILSGAHPKNAGTILIDGHAVEIGSPRDAQALGIGIIYQEFTLIPQLSAAENIFLGTEPERWRGFVDRHRLVGDSERLLLDLGVRIDPRSPVRTLGVAQQQMVEVAKALSRQARIMIMDEPTSALTSREVDRLFKVIARLTERGVAIVYISHRMEEVFRVGHRVTVLRDGRQVATRPIADVSVAEIVRLMANRELGEHFPKRRVALGPELLRVERLCRGRALRDISFTLHVGEVLGIAGLLGAGRTELARAIVGVDQPDAGRVVIKGQDVRLKTPAHAIRRRIGFLPEDRKVQGLVPRLSVTYNISLPHLARLSRLGVMNATAEVELAQRSVDNVRIKTAGLGQNVMCLSGGNQQKVVLAKWLAGDAEILIFDEPTRGIDVGSKIEIYHLMNRLTAGGAGIVMISSELPEILGMSDRILVMHQGEIRAELDAGDATEEIVLNAALGLVPALGADAHAHGPRLPS